ncbi:hypothetical protein DFJ74DRAFT_150128 [Hyaloraphidium curvatum]|nr:hypothetical protein DFJ74DRAFT_150128 [Hyaloraphidium curvatum]
MGRILAETDGRLVNWVNAVNNGWAYSGLRISSSNASADLAITLKLNALQLQGARNNSVFQGVPGRSLVLFRFDRTLRNVVGQPIRNALNLNNVENRGLWEYTYSLSEGEYIFVAYPNTSRIPQELTKDVFVPGDSIYRTFGFWLKNQVPASTFEKLSVGLASGEPTQMVVDTAVAQTVPNSTYTLLPNAAWQILTNPVVGPTQLSSKIMYAYDQADTAVIPVQRMNFAFFNGTDYEPLPSYYDGNTLFTNATFVGNGWTSLAITNQIGSNFSIPAPTTSATASATSTMTRTASKTMRPDAIPDATTQGSGASRLAFSLLQLVALMLTVAIMQL